MTTRTSPLAKGNVADPASLPPSREHANALRGSSLLLVGRLLAMALALVTQVLLVRYLQKSQYGTFAYAIALAAIIQSVLPLGLDRADTRFLALYDERRDHARMLGVIATEATVIAGTGIIAIGALVLFRNVALGSIPTAGHAVTVVLVLAAGAPLAAIDGMVLNVFAVFARPKEVFFRRYVLDPSLRLIVVAILITQKMSVVDLAIGYVLATLTGTLLYLYLLARLLRRVVRHAAHRFHVTWPGRELAAFAFPLLSAAVAYSATTSLPAIVLGHLGSVGDVAELRAIQPVAALVIVVPTVFATLFTPQAARFAARSDFDSLRRHYWATATWIAVLAFPAAVMMIDFSGPVTSTLFGERYASAAPMLVILGVAFYLNAALGLNGSVLQVLGRLRTLTVANIIGLVIALGTSALLIPWLHGVGAAIAVALAIVVPQLVKQRGLASTPVKSSDGSSVRLWLTAGLILGAVRGLSMLGSPNIAVACGVAIVAEAALVAQMHRWLDLGETFPEAAAALGKVMARLPQVHRRPASMTADVRQRTVTSEQVNGSQGGGKRKPSAQNAIEPWHQVDWRFLLDDPAITTVWLSPACRDEAPALRAVGIEVSARLTSKVDVAWVAAGDLDFDELTQALLPGALVRITVTGAPPSKGLLAALRPWDAWRRVVAAHGWTVVSAAWAAPSAGRPRAYASVDNRLAVGLVLRISPAGRVGMIKARVAAAALGLGLSQLLCRQGVLLARIPS